MSQRIALRLAALLALLVGPLAWVSPNSLAVALPLFAMAAAIGAGGGLRLRRALSAWPEILPLLLLAALSLAWTPVPALAAGNFVKFLAGLGFALLLVHSLPRLPVSPAPLIAWGLGGMALLVCVDALLGFPAVRLIKPNTLPMLEPGFYSRGAAFAALIMPLLLWQVLRAGRPRLALALLLSVTAAIHLVHGSAAKLALLAALLALPLVWWRPTLGWIGPGVLAGALLLATLPFPVHLTPAQACQVIDRHASAYHRLLIWNYVTSEIERAPWLGHGFDSARSLPGGRQRVAISYCTVFDGFTLPPAELLPLHPHNGALQMRLELGWLGAGAALIALVGLARRGLAQRERDGRGRDGRGDRSSRTGAGLVWVAALPLVLFSYGLWQDWWVASLGLAAALVAAGRQRPETPDPGQ